MDDDGHFNEGGFGGGRPGRFLDLRVGARRRADQLADAILSLERFDRVEKATQLGRQ
jgi:hypothetical protein